MSRPWDYEGRKECEGRWRERIAKLRKENKMPCKGNPLGEGKKLSEYPKAKSIDDYRN
jgi:hypothetical protein